MFNPPIKKAYKIIITLSIASMFLFSFGVSAQTPYFDVKQPETIDEARKVGGEFAKEAQKQLPSTINKIFRGEVLPLWQKVWNMTSGLFKQYFEPQLDYWWFKLKGVLSIEVEKRKPVIKEEFEKEKEEVRQELPGLTKDLWERLGELIK
ncbi:MAG: hypothetical protein HYW70_01205 [Candidatus Nealsonbacteria bacterium]|nr:hypothetical protein [Candidatus Nealsonbacteria bacterium]